MDEDQILQSIIADPDKVDPTIDVSKLRQTTPTDQRLLSNVSGIEGLRFDPTRTDYIRDLYSVYSGGLPTIDVAQNTAQIPGAIDTLVNVGGGGIGQDQVTGDSMLDAPTNTDFEQGLIDQGIGVQGAIGDPVVAPGEIPVTQEEIDAFNAPAVLDSTSTADEIMQDLNNQQAMLNPTGVNIMDEVALTGGVPDTNITAPSGDIFAAGDPLAAEKIDLTEPQTDSLSTLARASNSIADFGRKVQDTLGGVFDSVNNTIDVFGQKFNVAKTATGLALNTAFGAPVSLAFDLIDSLPQSNQSVADVLTQTYGVDDQGRVQGNPATNVFAGMNAVSMFGDPIQAAQKRVDNVVDPAKKDLFQKQLNEVVNKSFVTEDDLIDSPTSISDLEEEVKGTANVEVDLPTSTVDTFRGPTIAEVTDGPGPDDSPSGPPEGPGITADDAFESTGGGEGSGSMSDAQAEANRDAAMGTAGKTGGGGGSGGGGGKIVCTMMNESYGFGSFRNKIWLKHSKDLAPEYQRGYHKIFLPLVKLSKNNKVLKTMLEHIAVHRTIDIRQESRGKVHPLGRVYRKILEPICYWVGKYAK
jgi:hypothetical protein